VLGALVALGGAAIVRAALGIWRRRGRARETETLEAAADRLECGLRDLAREVEDRLEQKLDRLEALVAEARALTSPPAPPGIAFTEDQGRAASEESFGDVSQHHRQRVLTLARMGKRAEAIAEEAGLPRGEVDLILRLHRSAERVPE
jgi:hypothetical protein